MKTITLVFTFLIITSISFAQIPTNGLVGYWPFDGNANDLSGNNLHGTVNGSTPISDRFGKTNSAYHFNGVSDFIEVSNDTLLNLPIMSVSVWMRKQSVNNQYEEILSKESASPNRNVNYKFQINTVNEMTFYAASDSAAALDNCANTTFTLANWNHFVGIYDGTNVKMYMNDTLISNICHPSHAFYPSITNGESLTFGRLSIFDPVVSSWMFYEGDIDDIRLYNRVVDSSEVHALFTEAQVSQNCIVGSLPISISHGLVAWYPFCGNANDETGNGFDGTVNGAALTTDRFGNNSSSYQFNGSTDYINIQNSILSQNNSTFSISAWFLSDTTDGAIISDRFDMTNQFKYYIGLSNTGLLTSGNFSSTSCNSPLQSTVTLHQWNNITITKDSSSLVHRMFLNGILVNSDSNYCYYSSLSSTQIGRWGGNNDSYFTGKIDDIRIYNRVLDSIEIAALYNENICFQTVTVTDTLIINANLTGFNPITYQNSIKIYPNPAYDHITIDNGSNYSTLAGYTLRIDNSLYRMNIFYQLVRSILYKGTFGLSSGIFYIYN
ncbi:MAG: LamG domain-containing protein [Bacteroidetes bacterium]|nr:LamG domain-containing protein [Bacteroidota bacterium]